VVPVVAALETILEAQEALELLDKALMAALAIQEQLLLLLMEAAVAAVLVQ
jgi:hypothetical protein